MNRRSLAFVCTVFAATTPSLKALDSHSDGSDGALDLSASPPGQVVFDPRSFDPPLDPDGDNVFHFTTITVPEGVELVFEARKLGYAPVYWLATGAVQIDGVLDLRGAPGHATSERRYAEPGPGGYHGGLGGRTGVRGTRGFGPGGGGGDLNPAGGSYGTRGTGIQSAGTYGNRFLLPLVGGSGGGGFPANRDGTQGRGAGAGGGAMLIAAPESVTIGGTINASGGDGATGGSGGAVRILAPIFAGDGTITVAGGRGFNPLNGGNGRIRVEATQRTFSGTLSGGGIANVVTLPPSPVFLPRPGPRVRMTRIAGVDVSASATGSFEVPDVAIDASAAVTVEIETSRIPTGTVVQLLILTEDSGDVVVETTPLVGTLESATASAEVTFSAGFSRVFIRATW